MPGQVTIVSALYSCVTWQTRTWFQVPNLVELYCVKLNLLLGLLEIWVGILYFGLHYSKVYFSHAILGRLALQVGMAGLHKPQIFTLLGHKTEIKWTCMTMSSSSRCGHIATNWCQMMLCVACMCIILCVRNTCGLFVSNILRFTSNTSITWGSEWSKA